MKHALPWKTALLSAFALGLAPLAGFAAEESPKVILPTVEVKAPPVPKERNPWRYAQVAGWEVLSEVTDVRARALLTGLQKFDFSLRTIQPRLVAGPATPLAILVVNGPAYQEIVGPTASEFSTVLLGERGSAIVVNTDAEFAMVEENVGPNTVNPERQLNREYLRYVLAAHHAPLPAWMEEGLAQALADVEFSGAWLTYGKVDTEQNMPSGGQPLPVHIDDYLAPNPALTGLSFKQVFTHRPLMPLEKFFAAQLPDGTAPSSDSAWAKQAYALVHFCLFGNKLRYQAPLAALATRLQTQPMSEEIFQESFGISYRKMEKQLRGYILYTPHKYQKYPLKPDQRLKSVPVDFREATDAEIARLTGTATGRSFLKTQAPAP